MEEPKYIQITDLTEDTLKFTLSNVDTSIANALRRIMIAEVPTVAIANVTIKENTSVLADDYIAHRLGLIPIRRLSEDPSTGIVDYNTCPGLNCDRCTVIFDLNVDCKSDIPLNVTSKDLISRNSNYVCAHSASIEESKAIGGNGIRIVTLAPGQSIHIECQARLDVAKVHTKWSPVGTCIMKYIPIVHLNKTILDEKDADFKQRLVESCPRNVFSVDSETQRITVTNSHECMFCGDCETLNTSYADKVVTISQIPNRFEFIVESNGSIRPLEILKDAISVLEDKLGNVKQCVSDIMFKKGN